MDRVMRLRRDEKGFHVVAIMNLDLANHFEEKLSEFVAGSGLFDPKVTDFHFYEEDGHIVVDFQMKDFSYTKACIHVLQYEETFLKALKFAKQVSMISNWTMTYTKKKKK